MKVLVIDAADVENQKENVREQYMLFMCNKEVVYMSVYMIEFTTNHSTFDSHKRIRMIEATSECEAEKKLIDLMYERLKKANPNRIIHKYEDIEVWKIEKVI